MKNQILLTFLFLGFLFSQSSAQYARLTFYSDTEEAIKVRINDKDMGSELVNSLRVRVNHKNKYRMEVFVEGNVQAVVEKKININPALISCSYVLKQNKKGEYSLKTRDMKMEQTTTTEPAQKKSDGGIKYTYKKTESSSGPDGSYSKSEEGSGSLNSEGLKSKSTKSSASMDENGLNMSSETKERGASTAGTLGALSKMRTKKKKKELEDGRDLVIEDIQLAAGTVTDSGPTPTNTNTSTTASPSGNNVSTVETNLGYEFYVMSDPARAYEVLFEVEANGVSSKKLLHKERGFKNVMDILAEEVQKENKKKKYVAKKADAILTLKGHEAQAIRFTQNGNDQLAKVHSWDGVAIFIAAEPQQAYELVLNYPNTTAMVGKPNISGRSQRTIKKIRKENPSLDFNAIITTDGRNFKCIKFK